MTDMGGQRRRRGTGSVFYSRSKKRWIAQVTVTSPSTGKSSQVRRISRSRDQARARLREMLDDPGLHPRQAPGQTLGEYLTAWAEGPLLKSPLAPATQRIYAGVIAWYAVPAAEGMMLGTLSPRVMARWLENVEGMRRKDGQTIAASTVRNTYIATIRALDAAGLPSNPLRAVPRPQVRRATVPATSAGAVDAVVAQARKDEDRLLPLIVFVAFTGVRIGEALALRWEDVDLKRGTATIRRGSLERDTTKSGRARTVTLLPEVVTALEDWEEEQAAERERVEEMGAQWPDHGLVFTTVVGTPVERGNASRSLKRLLKKVRAETSRPWHSLRHGLATRLIEAGVPLATVSAVLGHSGIGITADTYGHVESVIDPDALGAALGR